MDIKRILKITNGKLLILIGIMHVGYGISTSAFWTQFSGFAGRYFFEISKGVDALPLLNGALNCPDIAAFWFLYFGILLIPVGILVNHIEKQDKIIPLSFIIAYLAVVLIGVYMVPNSGMTFFMLPQAVYMLVSQIIKTKKA